MRKLAVIGALAVGVLSHAPGARATTVDTTVDGTLANNTNTCIQVLIVLTTEDDCSYAATRYPSPGGAAPAPTWTVWKGPLFAAGFYPIGSPPDGNLDYIPTVGDGKLADPMTGTLTIDDNGTPADGTDDKISGTLEFGPAVHFVGTGQGNDSAIEKWTKMTTTLAATTVNFATARVGGGFDYVIGSRGMPTPRPGPLAGVGNNTGTFPSETVKNFDPTNVPLDWQITGSTALAVGQRVGIERSAGYGNVDDTGNLQPNLGAQTTTTWEGYQCMDDLDNPALAGVDADYDCSGSAILLGSGQNLFLNEDGTRIPGNGTYLPTVPNSPGPGNCNDGNDNDGDTFIDAADTLPLWPAGNLPGGCNPLTDPNSAGLRRPIFPPGFENLILRVSTTSTGQVIDAEAYWTREWTIPSGPVVGNDNPTGPPSTRYATKNSWVGGRFTLTGRSNAGPVTVDDTASVVEGTVDAPLLVTVNDSLSGAGTNTLSIVSAPAHGTATISGNSILYSPTTTDPPVNTYYDGADSLTYKITDGNLIESAAATVSITVTVKKPVATNPFGTSTGGAPVARQVLTNANNLGSGTVAEHTLNPGAGTLGTCTATPGDDTLTFTPSGGNGTGGCSYTITDVDGDVSNTGQFTVTVSGSSGGGGGGSSGPQLPSGGSLDLFTLGALLAGVPLVARRRRKRC